MGCNHFDCGSFLFYRMDTCSISHERRDTSESDLFLIGTSLYGDTLSRLDGGIDHKNLEKNLYKAISTFSNP